MNDLQDIDAPLLDGITDAPQSTALVILPAAQFPTIIAADKDDILGKLSEELRGFKGDVTTEKGRKEIASKAHKVSIAKMNLVRLSDQLKADAQKLIKGVNAERNQIEERMDELRDQVRKPLNDFEQKEAARVKGHQDAIEAMLLWCVPEEPYTSGMLRLKLDVFEAQPPRDWQEFSQKAADTDAYVRRTLLHMIEVTETAEQEAAEVARLREEEAARAQAELERLRAEREAEIARQAAGAAKLAAEQAAAEEAARVAREAEEARLEAERAAQRADYHRRMLQHVKNCGFGFIDDQPQALGILQYELTTKIKYDEENFGDLLAEALTARDEALKVIQRTIDVNNRRHAEEEAAAAALAKAEREANAAADRAARLEQEKAEAAHRAKQVMIETIQWFYDVPAKCNADWELKDQISHTYSFLNRIDEVLAEHEWGELETSAKEAHDGCHRILEERKNKLTAQQAEIEAAEAERQKKLAADKAEALRLAAIKEEQDRVEGLRIQQEAETRRREADKQHRARINREARDAIVKAINSVKGSSSEPEMTAAKAIVEAIAKGEVPNVRITY